MLNIALTSPYPKLNDTLMDDETFQAALSGLLEHQSLVLRGKALLAFLQLFSMNPHWFVIAIEMKFYSIIDKLLRDNFKYVQCCLYCVLDSVAQMIPTIMQDLVETFNNYLQGIAKFDEVKSHGLMKVLSGSKSDFQSLRGGLLMVLGVQEMMNSSAFTKFKVFKADFIQNLAYLLENYDKIKTQTMEEFGKALYLIAESLAAN